MNRIRKRKEERKKKKKKKEENRIGWVREERNGQEVLIGERELNLEKEEDSPTSLNQKGHTPCAEACERREKETGEE